MPSRRRRCAPAPLVDVGLGRRFYDERALWRSPDGRFRLQQQSLGRARRHGPDDHRDASRSFLVLDTHSANKQCCSAPYAGIGTIGGQGKEWTSDQYGQPGSHLPIMLADIEALKGSWRFKVPMPTSSQDQYHVYYEIYICDNTKGLRGKGNIAIGLWDNEFYHQSYKGGL